MIADIVFDLPLARSFSYRVPPHLAPWLRVGQRVTAPLQRRPRHGVVVGLREGTDASLEGILELADPVPFLSPVTAGVAQRVGREYLSSWGSSCAALLPPPRSRPLPIERAPASTENPPPPRRELPVLLIGGDREEQLLDSLQSETRESGFLLIAPEIEDAEAWTRRLGTALGWSPLCFHSGRPDGERYASWLRLAQGRARGAVTTRAGLLAPIPGRSLLAVVDEHDPAHKSPASPRLHARAVAEWRAGAEGHRLLLTSASPSVESWWRAEDGQLQLAEGRPASWPEGSVVDRKRSDPGEPFSPPLLDLVGEALSRHGQVLLLATRLGYAPALTCRECGFSPRCTDCRIGLAFRRQTRQLHCHLCRRQERAPALCPRCRGRTLTARGWGTERMEEAAKAAFPRVPLVRYDGESARGVQGRALRHLIASGKVPLVVGTRSAIKLFARGALGAVAAVDPDPLLHLPDFRAAERTFQLLWDAAERVGGGGRLIVQTHHPDHYAFSALVHQDLATFYRNELKLRAELAYPPWSRLARIVVRGRERARVEALADRINRDLVGGGAGLTIYGPAPLGPARGSHRWQLIVKGDRELPARLGPALEPLLERRGPGGARIEVDMDPMELV